MNLINILKIPYRSLLNLNKKIHTITQSQQASYKEHHNQYLDKDSLKKHNKCFEKYEKENLFNQPGSRFQDLLNKHQNINTVAIDIGCGVGWISVKLSPRFEKVIAIEPSNAALNTAKILFPQNKYSNIEWIEGFAENILAKLKLEKPSFFITGCVLSHLTDKSVKQICETINKIGHKDSILAFSECWGTESHEFMWHVRTKEWWQENMRDWKLDFHGPMIQNIPGRHKGFHGVKIK